MRTPRGELTIKKREPGGNLRCCAALDCGRVRKGRRSTKLHESPDTLRAGAGLVEAYLFRARGLKIRRSRIHVLPAVPLARNCLGPFAGSILPVMQQVLTQIDIQAPASLVWAILADFGTYRRWNPLIRGVLGRPTTGAEIEVRLRSPVGNDLSIRSTVVRSREPRELRWLERWSVPGLFRSERRFRIESLPEGGVRFHHSEQVQGIMVPLLSQRRRLRGRSGFDAMNSALKQRAERALATSP